MLWSQDTQIDGDCCRPGDIWSVGIGALECLRNCVVLNLNFTPAGVNMATGDPDPWNNTPQERSGMATLQVHTRHRSTSPLRSRR